MTQATSRPPASAPAGGRSPSHLAASAPAGRVVQQPGLAERRTRAQGAIRRTFEGSPGRLRLAAIGAVLACLVFALLGASAFQARGNALADANADATQLIRVQQAATDLVKADSLLTNQYLGSGSAQQQQDFYAALDEAARLVVDAAQANPDDAPALAGVSASLGEYRDYAGRAQSARRLGYQVGTGYLRQAGAVLRGPGVQSGQTNPNPNLTNSEGMLPALQAVITANANRVDGAYSAAHWAAWRLALAGLIVLGGLVYISIWLARRTRRYLNVPLFSAGLVVLVVVAVGAGVMMTAQGRANRVYDGPYSALRALANARIAAYTAKSDDNIALLYIGLGGGYASYQKDATAQLATVESQVSAAAQHNASVPSPTEWTGQRLALNKAAADPNTWYQASQDASDPNKQLNTSFNTFDSGLDSQLQAQAKAVHNGLGGHAPLLILGWLALVVGILAAVAGWTGIAQRLEEYR
jgi:hypothetical protein